MKVNGGRDRSWENSWKGHGRVSRVRPWVGNDIWGVASCPESDTNLKYVKPKDKGLPHLKYKSPNPRKVDLTIYFIAEDLFVVAEQAKHVGTKDTTAKPQRVVRAL